MSIIKLVIYKFVYKFIQNIYQMSLCKQILQSPEFKEVDIVKKYFKHPDFKKQLNKIQQEYAHDLNMSLYSNLENLQKCGVIQAVRKTQNSKLFVNFYAHKMDFSEEESYKMFLLFIRILDQKLRQNPNKKYSLIYYHCLSDSSYPFSFLNETFKKLPLFYYAMLQKIYVIQPNFLVKNTVGIFDFSRLHKLFSRRLQYVNNLYELGKIQQIVNNGVLDHLPDILKHQKALKQQKKGLKQQGALENISNKNPNQFTVNEQPIILKSVQKQDFLTIPLESHKLSPDGLPIALQILLQTFKANPHLLQMQGIFRKNGSCEQQQQIIIQLSKMTIVAPIKNLQEYSGFAIASAVKKFFTKLSIPIIPYEIYNQIMTISSIEEGKQVEFVRQMLSKLPLLNKKVLLYLIIFLKQEVISRQEKNKMNNYNMSVCFCPCIFRAKQASLQDLMNSGKYAKILDILFSKFEEVVGKQEIKNYRGKQNRGSKGSKGSRGSHNSKENRKSNQDSPTRIL